MKSELFTTGAKRQKTLSNLTASIPWSDLFEKYFITLLEATSSNNIVTAKNLLNPFKSTNDIDVLSIQHNIKILENLFNNMSKKNSINIPWNNEHYSFIPTWTVYSIGVLFWNLVIG